MTTPDAIDRTVIPSRAVFSRGRVIAAILVFLALYLALLVAHAMTRRPWNDESMFANPAWNFATQGFLGTTVMDEAAWHYPLLHRYTYYMFPLNLVVLAGWFKLVGFGLLQQRILSMLWTLVFLAAWAAILRTLLRDWSVALLGCLLIALDYQIMIAGSFGRYDMMVAALGFGSYAVYLLLRERHLAWAVVLSQACVTACGITHPNGLLFFTGLLTLTLYSDRRRIRWQHVLLAAIPYCIGAVAWGCYILQSPSSFRTQLTVNSYNRVAILHPFEALWREITLRYMPGFGFPEHSSPGHVGPVKLKVLPLLLYIAGLFGCVSVPRLRQHPGVRTLLVLTAVHVLYLTFFEGMKFSYYLVHITPLYGALLAVFLAWLWRQQRLPRWAVAGAVAVVLASEVGGVLLKIKLDTYHQSYLPAVNYLRDHARPTDLIMASSELGFAYGFRPNLLDDLHLGFETGKRAEYIVVEEIYQDNLDTFPVVRPAVSAFATRLLRDEYELVYDHAFYRIYRRAARVSK